MSKFHLITGVGVSCPSVTVTDPGDRQLQPGAELAASQHQSLAGAADRRSWWVLLVTRRVGLSEAAEVVRSFPSWPGNERMFSQEEVSARVGCFPVSWCGEGDLSTWPHSQQQQ